MILAGFTCLEVLIISTREQQKLLCNYLGGSIVSRKLSEITLGLLKILPANFGACPGVHQLSSESRWSSFMGLAANPKTPVMYAYFLEPEVPCLVKKL